MSKLTTVSLAAAGVLFLSAPAYAVVTVVNETGETHEVTFDHGHDEVKHTVEPDAQVEEACPETCGVRFSGHDIMASDGDTLAITEGSTRPVLKDG